MIIVFTVNKNVIAQIRMKETINIGSSSKCDVCIPYDSVDENHCRIILSNGGLYLQDMGSNKYIALNGTTIERGVVVEMQEGILRLGDVDVEVSFQNETPVSDTKKSNNNRIKYSVIAAAVVILIGVIAAVVINQIKGDDEVIIESETEEIVEETEPTIGVINLENATISVIDNQLYTGAPVFCSFEVSYEDIILTEGADYSCIYDNNIGLGTATITFNGNGVTTTGSNARTFTIITGDSVCDDASNRSVLDFVVGLYTSALNRYPEPAILVSYVNQLVNQEIAGSDLVNIVYNSGEFANRNLTDEDFLTSVYRGILNREPGNDAYRLNLALLRDGMSRYEFTSGIIDDYEFENLCESIGIISQIES